MTRPNLPIDRTADALECFLCLMDPDADPRSRARWTAWLSENPENRAAYHAVRDTWSQPVPGDVWPTHEEVTNDTYDAEIPMADEIARRKREARGPGGSGGVPATTYRVVSPTTITAVAPPAAVGFADVLVSATGGTSAINTRDRFKYLPSIESLTPNAGSTAGGTSVTVTGNGFALGTGTVFKFADLSR